jgi:hypothetical protein
MGGVGAANNFDGRLGPIIFYDAVLLEAGRDFLFNETSDVYGRKYAEVIGDIEATIEFIPRFEGI